MGDEKKVEEKVVEEKKVEEKTPETGKDEKGKEPSYEELKGIVSDLQTKFVPKKVVEDLKSELDGVKETAGVVERIKEAISGVKEGASAEEEARAAAFYKLLIKNPAEAIRQVIAEERNKERVEERERVTEREFKKFAARFPEYKDYEEDMKAELLANPGWFKRPNFIQRVFFDVLAYKNPTLLQGILASGRGVKVDEVGDFVFEGASQTDHGSVPSGKDILSRMRAAGSQTKSFFE